MSIIQTTLMFFGVCAIAAGIIYISGLVHEYVKKLNKTIAYTDDLISFSDQNTSTICKLKEELDDLKNKIEQLQAYIKDYTGKDPNTYHTCKDCTYSLYSILYSNDEEVNKVKYCTLKQGPISNKYCTKYVGPVNKGGNNNDD